MQQQWLSVREVADLKGVTRQAVMKAIKKGRLAAQRVGKYYVISQEALDAWTKSRQEAA